MKGNKIFAYELAQEQRYIQKCLILPLALLQLVLKVLVRVLVFCKKQNENIISWGFPKKSGMVLCKSVTI